MSQYSTLFSKAPVDVPKFSGFDMSHMNIGTLKVGTLVPVLVEPLYPNDKISVGANINVQLPPMASDFIGKVDVELRAFFVPNRILWQGWQRFYNNRNVDTYTTPVTRIPKLEYQFEAGDDTVDEFLETFGAGSLSDYLGIKTAKDSVIGSGQPLVLPNPLPYLAYHMIYDRWFRDKTIQRPLFATPDEIRNMLSDPDSPFYGEYSFEQFGPAMMPYRFGYGGMNAEYMSYPYASDESEEEAPTVVGRYGFLFADGSSLFELRQRNWAKDYFTIATPSPQAGEPAKVEFTVVDGNGKFSISALRAANALQKFAEKRNLAGSEYDQQILVDWGIKPADAVLQHPIYLGGMKQNVYNRAIMQTGNGYPANVDPNVGIYNTRNPFASTVGASFGKSQALGSGSLVDSFHAKEHGFFIVLACLVPHSFYSTGTRKYLTYNQFTDFPNPAFVGVGDQEIMRSELASFGDDGFESDGVFGYTQRYAEKKFHLDEVHGLLRDGENLEHFTVQRGFELATAPMSISSAFIQIGTDAMDNVSAVQGDISKFGAWYEIAFKENIVSAFPAYSIPTLGDEKHTKSIMVDKGGPRL